MIDFASRQWNYKNADHPGAVRCFENALKEKNPDPRAYHFMGLLYQSGYGLKVDVDKAIECFTKARDGGVKVAEDLLSKLQKKYPEKFKGGERKSSLRGP